MRGGTIQRADIEAKRQELVDRLAAVRTEAERLTRLAVQLQGAVAGLDELLTPDIAELGIEVVADGTD